MTTHPTTGGGTTGPGRILAALRNLATVRRANAAAAGARSTAPTPMDAERRVDGYRRQTGRTELTPAQRRRAVKKAVRSALRAAGI